MQFGKANVCPVIDWVFSIDISVDLSLLYGGDISLHNSEKQCVPVRGLLSDIGLPVDLSFLWS
jgi:hypothetical protein